MTDAELIKSRDEALAAIARSRGVLVSLGELAAVLVKYLDDVEVDLAEIRAGLLAIAKVAEVSHPTTPADPWVRFRDAFPPK
jgi:hypothetical protein